MILVLAIGLGGCAGGEDYTIDEGRIAERYLPTEREIGHHPDSVEVITLDQGDNKLEYNSDLDYEGIWRKWSVTFQNIGTGRNVQQPLSYATLWGMELAMATLRAEGIFALTEDKAWEIVNKRRRQYRSSIRIEVVWFVSEGRSELTGPSAHVRLRIGDEEYQPVKEDRTPVREAFLDAGQTGLYRRNIFHFPRVVEDEDILKEAEGMTLEVRPINASDRIEFRWTWEDAVQASIDGG